MVCSSIATATSGSPTATTTVRARAAVPPVPGVAQRRAVLAAQQVVPAAEPLRQEALQPVVPDAQQELAADLQDLWARQLVRPRDIRCSSSTRTASCC